MHTQDDLIFIRVKFFLEIEYLFKSRFFYQECEQSLQLIKAAALTLLGLNLGTPEGYCQPLSNVYIAITKSLSGSLKHQKVAARQNSGECQKLFLIRQHLG